MDEKKPDAYLIDLRTPMDLRELPKEMFKEPPITKHNLESFVKLDELYDPRFGQRTQGMSEEQRREMKRQLARSILQGSCQEERKRVFIAFVMYCKAHQQSKASPEKLMLEFMNEFEIELMNKILGHRMRDGLGLLKKGEVSVPDPQLSFSCAPKTLPEDPHSHRGIRKK